MKKLSLEKMSSVDGGNIREIRICAATLMNLDPNYTLGRALITCSVAFH
jgi:hypothetical protein